eukprot:jgi/Botrbrau1/2679/Bobra.0203s0023.1
MNNVVSCLKQGVVGRKNKALVVWEDSVETVGSLPLLAQIIHTLVNACKGGCTPFQQVCHLDIDRRGHQYVRACQASGGNAFENTFPFISAGTGALAQVLQPPGADGTPSGSQAASTKSSTALKRCIVINSLSGLLLIYSPAEVLAYLEDLLESDHVASVLAVLHTELQEAHILAGLEDMAACVVRVLEPPPQSGLAAGPSPMAACTWPFPALQARFRP